MGFLDVLQKGWDVANKMADNYLEELKNERIHAEKLSDEVLKYKAVHGITMAQRVAAMEELKNRGYGNEN